MYQLIIMGIFFTINYICGYFGICSVNFINFRTPIYVCRYINFLYTYSLIISHTLKQKREIQMLYLSTYVRGYTLY